MHSTDTVTSTVTVDNVDPTFSLVAVADEPSSSEVGCTVEVVDFVDPGQDTVSAWVIDWGDGTSTTYTGEVTSFYHAFQAGGQYTITATATDEDGSYSQSVTVELPTVVTIEPASAGGVTINEGENDVAAFVVKRASDSGALDVAVRVSDVEQGTNGQAAANEDYVTDPAITGGNNDDIPVNFAPGELEKTIYLSAFRDGLVEGDEIVTASLYEGYGTEGYGIGAPSTAQVTIKDSPVLSVETIDDEAEEGDVTNKALFRILAESAGNQSVTAYFRLTGAALAGTDYEVSALPVTLVQDDIYSANISGTYGYIDLPIVAITDAES